MNIVLTETLEQYMAKKSISDIIVAPVLHRC